MAWTTFPFCHDFGELKSLMGTFRSDYDYEYEYDFWAREAWVLAVVEMHGTFHSVSAPLKTNLLARLCTCSELVVGGRDLLKIS